jgi:hypothetical protein
MVFATLSWISNSTKSIVDPSLSTQTTLCALLNPEILSARPTSHGFKEIHNSGNVTLESISTVVDNLALAMTDSARSEPYPGVHHIPGTICESTICIKFNWPWFYFPAARVALTAISLASITSVTTSKESESSIWTLSILPLVYGRDTESDHSIFGESAEEIKHNTKTDMLIFGQRRRAMGI